MNSEKILVSALSCNPDLGSEGLVGYKIAETLARRYQVSVFASPPFQTPAGAEVIACNAGQCNFNEVGAAALMRFEFRQLRKSRKLQKHFQFGLVHRITPSAIQNPSFLGLLGYPLLVGPVIAARLPPPSFEPFLRRPVSPPRIPKIHPARLAGGACRRFIDRIAASHWHLSSATKILVGNREALTQIPAELNRRCEFITYAGVEHERFLPPNRQLKNGFLRLLYVGRLVPYKGLELLLRAVARVQQKCRVDLAIVGAGDPVYSEFLQCLAGELGINQFVRFGSPVARADLLALYQRADVFCFPSLCDTYGIALLEAMSCGCVPLVSDAAGPSEIVRGNGLSVPLTNPEQFVTEYSRNIIELAKDSALRRRLAYTARQHIIRYHDWGRIGRRLLEIYQSLEKTA